MAKTRIGSNAQFASAGKGLSIVGDHCYAYSGSVTDAASGSAAAECLNFTTGKGYIIAEVNWASDATGGDTQFIDVTLNGIQVWDAEYDAQPAANDDQPIKFLLPPYSHFIWKWGISSGTKRNTVILVGRVYA